MWGSSERMSYGSFTKASEQARIPLTTTSLTLRSLQAGNSRRRSLFAGGERGGFDWDVATPDRTCAHVGEHCPRSTDGKISFRRHFRRKISHQMPFRGKIFFIDCQPEGLPGWPKFNQPEANADISSSDQSPIAPVWREEHSCAAQSRF